ncbi:hypothetical protein GCM10010168_45110 [Actinoplanes ianthinogenes]|uniref:GerMN domain-containing protein n=1 Tax=Actinoplanes ianthinogenes TaxID=122358 RepID=A0ABM7LPN2_9ACTN|nr:hypothetical protein [Actinoplanes ianthinogenes]BCJ41191.1 hypothetical protein Aiant_18480 [Actinoplanes ianthinogenes]GGR22310.1 hypothetical protein GCM10010168_45110 [Actinoplanes ianthinogenes]
MGKSRKRRPTRAAPPPAAPPPAPEPPRPHRVRKALLATAGTVLTTLLVLVVTGAAGQIVDVPAAQDRLRALSDRLFGGDDEESAADPAAGSALRVDVLDVDGSYGQVAAFPAEPASAWQPFFQSPDLPTMAALLTAGGWAGGGLKLTVSLESRRTQDITVFDVRPVRLHRRPIPHGAVVSVLNQGAPLERMAFDLDSPQPVARKLTGTDPAAAAKARPFFEVQTVPLPQAGARSVLLLEFTTLRAAYDFGVAIDYTTGGRSYTQELPGGPYRVAADLCQAGAPALHYDHVRTVSGGADGTAFTMTTQSSC